MTILRLARRRPLATTIAIAACAVSLYVAAFPFTQARYPPITDLPFHAATISILRHGLDPAFHFREQFTLHWLDAPYWTHHALGALLALVLSVGAATKVATAILLLMLPAGLAVLFHGMKKSPLLGLFGLPFTWNTLTHWGFINFMAAIGLFAMVVGVTLMLLDRPTRGKKRALAALLVLVFLTHVFRFPFAIAAVVGTAVVMYPATRRFRPILGPLVPSLLLMGAWLLVREKDLSGAIGPLEPHTERFAEIPGLLFGALTGPEERRLADRTYLGLGAAAFACLGAFVFEERLERWTRRELYWAAGVFVVPLCIAAVFLFMFLSLPMSIGFWWYVYPREIVATLFVAVALVPDLPRRALLRVPILCAIAFGPVAQTKLVADAWASFDASTADFSRLVAELPPAPKLAYLVFDREHPRFLAHPYIHMPAWVQAEKGGWLSFHFVSWNAWPLRYREGSRDVPPPTPLRFEWTPEQFDLQTRGKFFDWFLVRRQVGPDPRFSRDRSVRLVDHAGPWWLYHRERP